MKKNENIMPNNENSDGAFEVSILDLVVILVDQRWFIAKITTAFTILAIIYALMATPIYKSSIQIMPPDGGAKSGAAAMLAASGLGELAGGIGATAGDTIVGVTKSTAVLDRVIDSNDLRNRKADGWSIRGFFRDLNSSYGGKPQPKMRTLVRSALSAAIQSAADKKSSIITVSVTDTSPEMAMKLANSVFEETQGVMQNIAVTPSAQQRVFLEQQLKENNKALIKAEQDFINFQGKTGMIGGGGAPTDIAALGALQARMIAKEIEIKSAGRFATSENPQMKKLQAEYMAIKRQFEENQATVGTTPLSGVGLKNLPESSIEYATLFREYKFRESLVTILLRQYESAKIREAQDPVVIQLLSPATLPELRDSPNRRKIVVLATLLGGFLGVFAAFIKHFLSLSANDPEVSGKMDFVKNALLGDYQLIKGKLRRKR